MGHSRIPTRKFASFPLLANFEQRCDTKMRKCIFREANEKAEIHSSSVTSENQVHNIKAQEQSLAMSSPNSFKEQRRRDILGAASAVFMGGTVRASDRITIKAIISQNPTRFESVVNTYGSDMVVQIVSSLIENGTLASDSNVQLAIHELQQPSGGRDRQHAALEQEVAHSEAEAVCEASQSDLAIPERNQGAEQIDGAGYNFCRTIIVDSANVYAKKPGQ